MGRRIGLFDIAYYGKQITVFEEPHLVKNKDGSVSKIPQASHYMVNQLQAEKVLSFREGTKQKHRVVATVPIKAIYSRIKMVYDFDGILIARRNAIGQPLQITGKGMSKFLRFA